MGAGKSTIARLLAEQLDIELVNFDGLRAKYFPAMGLQHAQLSQIERKQGFSQLYRYLKPYELAMVEQVLQEHSGAVFDFGAGNADFEEPEHIARLQVALQHYVNVFTLLPCADVRRAMLTLADNAGDHLDIERLEVNRKVFDSASMRSVSHHLVYTESKTPWQTTQDIVALCKLPERV